MKAPNYSGSPSKLASTATQKGILAMSILTPPAPSYTGDPGTGTVPGTGGGGQGAPNIVKTITFTVLSPQLSLSTAPPSTGAAEVSPSSKHAKAAAIVDALAGTNGPGPVAKSQPVVIAVPDKAKSYTISAGSLAFPAASSAGVIPPIPAAMPVGIDQPPKGSLSDTDAQVQITVSWALLPGVLNANAGDYKTLITVNFYDQ
jgi:hypothetical protein